MKGEKGETSRETAARKLVGPFTRHGMVTAEACSRFLDSFEATDKPGLVEFAMEVKARAERAISGDLEASSEMLMAQAVSLDNIFSEYARIALVNVTTHMDASERYMRLALKAQSNSRATLEALAKLHQPREQTVRHVHVNEGGQAVIADQFHNHTGGPENAKTDEQPHAPENGTVGESTPMLGHDPEGNGVPVSSSEGEPALPDARRKRQRRA